MRRARAERHALSLSVSRGEEAHARARSPLPSGEKQKLADELQSAQRKLSKADLEVSKLHATGGGGAGGAGGDAKAARVIQRKINELEHKIKCHVCGDREKNCVITRCFHVFCRTCIDDNVKNRIRKCPACSLPFGDKDTHDIYLVA